MKEEHEKEDGVDYDLRTRLSGFLASYSTLSLATRREDGQPLVASLFFAADEDVNLYFTSGAKSRHSLNLSHDPRAAVTVHAETWDWREIAGVQMEGRVTPVPPGPEWDAAWALFVLKFPFVIEFKAEVARSTFYRFEPHWARLIDNRLGFGHKEEIAWEPASAS